VTSGVGGDKQMCDLLVGGERDRTILSLSRETASGTGQRDITEQEMSV